VNPLLAADITVGVHPQTEIFGLTINVDTVWATAVAMLVVFALGFAVRRRATSGVPGRFQLAWELGVQAVTQQVEGSIGPRGLSIVPLAMSLFVFIIVCNFFEIFGLGARYEFLIVPNADVNLPAAMALVVIVMVHTASIRTRGFRGYCRHYLTQPFPKVLMPFNLFINLVEEIAKPITLALRLFGNLLSGTLLLSLIAYLGVWKLGAVPIGNVLVFPIDILWKVFDLAIGAIQAFIFALLTIMYLGMGMSRDAH
jgi:F-type H+-transporting ATPase subunit a